MADRIELTPTPGLAVSWDRAQVETLPRGSAAEDPIWRLEGELGPGFEALRVVTGATEDGTLLLLCAARPPGATHDADAIAATVTGPDGEFTTIAEALFSTEYAADGSVRRLGLELYREDDDYPIRGAGDATASRIADDGDERRTVAELDLRLDGASGAARYEIVRPG